VDSIFWACWWVAAASRMAISFSSVGRRDVRMRLRLASEKEKARVSLSELS
jgi:hypothetical protein